MKVVHYCQHALLGQTGVANSARGWAEALARRGCEVTLVVDEALADLGDVPGTRCIRLPHRRLGPVRVPMGLTAHLRGADVAVVHGGWHPGNTAAAAVARRAGTPYLLVTHGGYTPAALQRSRAKKRVWAAAVERRLLKGAVGVQVLFSDEREGLTSLGVDPPLLVVPNGIDPPDARWDGGSGGYLVFVGRYDLRQKGLDVLLAGLARLPPADRPTVRLHGTGTPAGRAEVERAVEDAALRGWVDVRDPVFGDDKWRALAEASAFVLTSPSEGAPMALIEAATIGVPILVTPFAMGRWMAEHGAARCVDPAPETVAAGLDEVTKPEAAELGARAADLVRRELTWDVLAPRWLEQVRQLLAARPR